MKAGMLGERSVAAITWIKKRPATSLLGLVVALQTVTLWFAISANNNAAEASTRADDAYSAAYSAMGYALEAASEARDAAKYAEDASERIRRLVP